MTQAVTCVVPPRSAEWKTIESSGAILMPWQPACNLQEDNSFHEGNNVVHMFGGIFFSGMKLVNHKRNTSSVRLHRVEFIRSQNPEQFFTDSLFFWYARPSVMWHPNIVLRSVFRESPQCWMVNEVLVILRSFLTQEAKVVVNCAQDGIWIHTRNFSMRRPQLVL